MKKLWVLFILVVSLIVGCASGNEVPTATSEVFPSVPLEPVEISLLAEVNGMVLDGILTVPSEGSSFPTVILVHGSGPNDKDASIFGNKPFRGITHGLASQGVASYRYDKGSFAYPERFASDPFLTMYGETINDAVAISEMVKTLPQVASDQVYILGHSLGGYSIPRIAQKLEVTGYIIMAGNVRPLSEMLAYQVPYLLDLDGVRTPEEEGYFNMIQGELAKLENLDSLPAGQLVLGVNKIYWMDLENYKPLEVAEGITEPVLVLQGERDYQVTMVDFSM